MAYELQWGSDKPGHFVFLIDLSESMEDKIDYVIDAMGKTCMSISSRTMSGIKPKERVSVSVYGYNYHIVELFNPNTSSEELARIIPSVIAGKPLFDKEGKAKPEYQTRMQLAFETAKEDIEKWIAGQEKFKSEGKIKAIPAPIVINITDGYPYEGKDFDQKEVYANTLKAAKDLMSINTPDGNVRIFNIHHNPTAKGVSLHFPSSRPLSDESIQFLYDASSPMTEDMINSAKKYFKNDEIRIGAKCLISNEKDVSNIVRFLEWGSSK